MSKDKIQAKKDAIADMEGGWVVGGLSTEEARQVAEAAASQTGASEDWTSAYAAALTAKGN